MVRASDGLPRLWRHLSDSFLASKTAAMLFLLSSLLTWALTPVFLGDVNTNNPAPLQNLLWGTLGVLGAAGMLFLWLGMWRYWSRLDSSPPLKKKLWFAVLLCGFWWGSTLYLWAVYFPQYLRAVRQRKEATL